MLDSLKKWFAPLSEPSEGSPPQLPPDFPERQDVTYNPGLGEATGLEPGFDGPAVPVATLWRVRRADSESEETDAVLDRGSSSTVDGPDDSPATAPAATNAGYRLHHTIAKGGFGEIWEATQEALSRVVAVKRLRQDLIDAHYDDSDKLRRLELAFRQEALVAAYLEHPNILPVHDLGVDEHGHLLLATKLVRGKPWDELLERDAELPLDRFLDAHLPILESVAKAVAFAHSRGVVHRDLKPTQVMVGEFGEVLLMDWGIAMFTADRPAIPPFALSAIGKLAPTRLTASNPAGTVSYMAPEQTENTVANIGPWTDVYLLGGILYRLLTGQTPHSGESRFQSFFQASMGIVASPWEVAKDRDLPPPLVELAMACLEPRREARLRSADEFLLMLGEYRAGASRRREATQMLARVRMRSGPFDDYKPLEQDLAMLQRALTLWPGFPEAERLTVERTLAYAKLALEGNDLKLARMQAERLPESHAERPSLLSEIDRREEESAQAKAKLDEALREARESYARADRLVTFLLEDLHRSLRAVNRLELMGKVGKEALDYFDALAEDSPTAASLAKRAMACCNIGDVFREQGRLEDSASAFRTFMELSQQMVALEPNESQWRGFLARAYERLSGVEYLRGKLDESMRLLEEGFLITEKLLGDRPGVPEYEFLNAKLTHQKGIVLWRRRKLEEAHWLQHISLIALARLSEEHPEESEYQQAHGWNLSTLGNVYRDLGNLPEAIRMTEQGLMVRSVLANADPTNKSYQDDVCWNLTNLALLREYSGEFLSALQSYDEAGRLRRRLVVEDPTNMTHRNRLTFILSSKARILYGLGRYAEAAEITAESCSLSRDIVAADPSNVHELGSHALNLGYRGLTLFHAGRTVEARRVLDESRPAARRALESVPENGVFQNAVCQALLLEGHLARLDRKEDAARACWQEAMDLLEKQFWRRTTGQGVGMHLELCMLLGRREEALADAEELRKNSWMMPRWEKLVAE